MHYATTTAVSCGLPLAREPSGGCLLLHYYAVISFAALYVSSVLWIAWDRPSGLKASFFNAHEDCIPLMYTENGPCV